MQRGTGTGTKCRGVGYVLEDCEEDCEVLAVLSYTRTLQGSNKAQGSTAHGLMALTSVSQWG